MIVGILFGGLWGAANAAVLGLAARTWMRAQEFRWPSLLWLLIKFPVLYAAAWLMLRQPQCSPAGFAIGFTVVLVLAGAAAAATLSLPAAPGAVDGR